MKYLKKSDHKIYKLIRQEEKRQEDNLMMIASENMASKAVLETMGTCLSNKYSEGMPQKRYYSGHEFVDKIELLAIKRAKELFSAQHANVQPHSGSQANQAAYLAVLKPRDKVLAMRLDHGGHLTHGDKVNFSGQVYNFIHYSVRRDDQLIDYDEVESLAKKYKPKMIICGASAYPRIVEFKKFGAIAKKVGAYLMSDVAHIAGLIAAGVHPHCFPYSDIATTTTHKTLRGPRGGLVLSKEKDHLCPKDKKTLAQKIDSAVFPGVQGGPCEHVIAAKAVCFKEALSPKFAKYQKQVVKNAKVLAGTLLEEGLELVSGGTDNHLVLVDLSNLGISGLPAQLVLEDVGISINRNKIPYDTRGAYDPSGIRLGTPALTTRGFKEKDIKIAGQLIAKVLKNIKSEKVKKETAKKVKELCKKFPFYLK